MISFMTLKGCSAAKGNIGLSRSKIRSRESKDSIYLSPAEN